MNSRPSGPATPTCSSARCSRGLRHGHRRAVELYKTDGAQGAARGAGIGAGLYKGPKTPSPASNRAVRTIEPRLPYLAAPYQEAYSLWESHTGSGNCRIAGGQAPRVPVNGKSPTTGVGFFPPLGSELGCVPPSRVRRTVRRTPGRTRAGTCSMM